ncbi:MAG: SEC-C domain-containing protein [Candidatus Hydrogenedentota bacterium]|nr:MAG: SEC-C domain-containing protein [Candidatus Hydrogenedentota bacterium]
MEERNYKWENERFWGVVHAVYLLGILGDVRAVDALLAANKFAQTHDIDWIWEAAPECYLRLGPEVVPRLKQHIEQGRTVDFSAISSEAPGLWNLWGAYPDLRPEIEAFFLQVIKDKDTHPEVRACLIGDFAQLGRQDLVPVFEGFFERGEVDLYTFTRDNLDEFLKKDSSVPGYRRELESFYKPEEIKKRQRRWRQEGKRWEREDSEDFILENYNRINRNDPCPCGSGKKFKKCHLSWALEERHRLKAEKAIIEEQLRLRAAVRTERHTESVLRKFLAGKGQSSLFSEMKEKALEFIKSPQREFDEGRFSSYFQPVFSRIEFENKNEVEAFMEVFMDYFNALSEQYSDFPRDGKLVH